MVLLFQWPKYWSFSFSISPCNEYSGLISFQMDCFDLLAVQETFRSLLQHHSLKVSILWRSAFFMVQLLQLYVTTGKTAALTVRTFVRRVMSLLSTHCLGLSLNIKLTLSSLPTICLCVCYFLNSLMITFSKSYETDQIVNQLCNSLVNLLYHDNKDWI